jgi:histidine triad (HIT) family protein
MNCLFCGIAEGQIEAKKVFEDEHVLAFHDINQQAPKHILIIPKRHIETIDDTSVADELLLGRLVLTAKKIAKEQHLSENGYRLVFNVNAGGGQEVYHIHLHLLGGRQMIWPPG